MKFTELQEILKDSLGIEKLADIARELNVTPQVVNNWKSKNNVPYKKVKFLRQKLKTTIKQQISEKSISEKKLIYNSTESSNEDGLIELLISTYAILHKNFKLFIIPVLVTIILASIHVNFFIDSSFVSSAKVVPFSEKNNSSGISNIASQFGLGGISGSSDNSITSSMMIPDILKSRRLASELLDKKFQLNNEELNLASILSETAVNVDSLSYKSRYYLTNNILKLISVKKPLKTKPTVIISVTTKHPTLSKDLVNAALNSCRNIINDYKYNELENKKDYINKRQVEISRELTDTEEKLKTFREKNRDILSSPALMLEQARLMRVVEVHTQLYIRLNQNLNY